ncbi:hypothetical protein [Ottowia sp.]|uniref:hypothetical protein n=1 Tax=Ottowia sp. TaxID=1898956 RepID=UPI0025EB0201|nr:hypothetical protein [Ottowia sp.]MBK6616404.1 hypothetical protein [Ottowia sp.]
MTTNYYWEPAGGVTGPGPNATGTIHIGLSAGGWSFHFKGYVPRKGRLRGVAAGNLDVRSWQQWKLLLSSGGRILDDRSRVLTVAEFEAVVAAYSPSSIWRPTGQPVRNPVSEARCDAVRYWRDAEGFGFAIHEFS